MPRQSRRPAPARPAPKPMAQQQRPSTTAAAPARSVPTPHPPAAASNPPAAAPSQGPGLFGQMASTAAGVAVGSSIGHAVGSMFTGGSSAPTEPTQASAPADNIATQSSAASAYGNCAGVFNMFSQCMEANNNDGNACQWYWQQLKSCQEAQNN